LCWEPSQRTAHLSLLEDLKAHVVDHFAREELLMEGMWFPGLAKHRQAHQRMRERLLARIVTWDEVFGEWLSLHPSM